MADVEPKTYSAKQVASRIGTDAKQLRKFFRDPNSGYKAVGQGGRYDFPEGDIPKIREAFEKWNATKVRRNRTPQKKTTAPLIPGQRKESPGTENTPRPPRPRRPEQLFKEGLHGNALDTDDFKERTTGIGARVKKHGLVPNQQGRLVEKPEHIRRAEQAKKAEPLEIDFSKDPRYRDDDPHQEMQQLVDMMERGPSDEELAGMDDLFDPDIIDFDDEDVEEI